MEKKQLTRIRKILTNKYLVTIIAFGIWMTFCDTNRIVDRMAEFQNFHQLEKDREYYLQKIDDDSKRMEELRTNKENLEKFAREQYLMKRANEDIFIILEED